MRPNVCGIRFRNPVVRDCIHWLIAVDSLNDIANPTHDNAWILPDNTIWVRNHDDTSWVLVNGGGADFNGIVELSNQDGFLNIGGTNPSLTINLNQQALNDRIDEQANKLIDEFRLHNLAPTEWIDIENRPETFPPLEHNHTISEITDLQNQLDNRVLTSALTNTGVGDFIGQYRAGDLLIQIGRVSVTASANANTSRIVTFPIEFASRPNIQVTAQETDTDVIRSVVGVTVASVTRRDFRTFILRETNGSANILWTAIGAI